MIKAIKTGLCCLVLTMAIVFVIPVQEARANELPESSFEAIIEAFGQIWAEAAERVEGSPLRVYRLLAESIQNGMMRLNMDVLDRWEDASIDITLFSNLDEFDFGLHFTFESQPVGDRTWAREEHIEFQLYISSERVAFGLPQVGSTLFGVTFATLDADIAAFAEAIDVDVDCFNIAEIMSEITPVLEFLQNPVWETPDLDFLTPYVNMFMSWLLAAEESATQADGTTRVAFSFTAADMAAFINELADMLEADNQMRAAYEVLWDLGFFWTRYDREIENLRWEAEFLDELVSGQFTLAFYMYEGRILSTEFSWEEEAIVTPRPWIIRQVDEFRWLFDDTIEAAECYCIPYTACGGDCDFWPCCDEDFWRAEFGWLYEYWLIYNSPDPVTRTHFTSIVLDFGRDIYDPWTLEIRVYEDDSFDGYMTFTWDFEILPDAYKNILTITEYAPWRTWRGPLTTYSVALVWTTESGIFTIEFTTDEPGFEDENITIEGIFLHNTDGSFLFKYVFDDQAWGELISYEISGQPNAPRPAINFINLDQWGTVFMEFIEEAMDAIF
ncbi:MAG: hypothetical protein FWB91_07025 [Defluviitaleaceae bacterium]|nr:hypothetical protein [Defluviitaleaceae bacterium]